MLTSSLAICCRLSDRLVQSGPLYVMFGLHVVYMCKWSAIGRQFFFVVVCRGLETGKPVSGCRQV